MGQPEHGCDAGSRGLVPPWTPGCRLSGSALQPSMNLRLEPCFYSIFTKTLSSLLAMKPASGRQKWKSRFCCFICIFVHFNIFPPAQQRKLLFTHSFMDFFSYFQDFSSIFVSRAFTDKHTEARCGCGLLLADTHGGNFHQCHEKHGKVYLTFPDIILISMKKMSETDQLLCLFQAVHLILDL